VSRGLRTGESVIARPQPAPGMIDTEDLCRLLTSSMRRQDREQKILRTNWRSASPRSFWLEKPSKPSSNGGFGRVVLHGPQAGESGLRVSRGRWRPRVHDHQAATAATSSSPGEQPSAKDRITDWTFTAGCIRVARRRKCRGWPS
jgi:hypothetical protein